MKKLIVFLVRKRLGLKKGEKFQFANQKELFSYYYFTDNALIKASMFYDQEAHPPQLSGVSLNWLMNDKCEIRKLVE